MGRVAEPLKQMGAKVELDPPEHPMVIEGGDLEPIEYELPVASGQVKSALLLAMLYAKGTTTVVEPVATLDHTDLMLQAAGSNVDRRVRSVSFEPPAELRVGTT